MNIFYLLLRVLRFSPVIIIPPLLRIQSFIYYRHFMNLGTYMVVKLHAYTGLCSRTSRATLWFLGGHGFKLLKILSRPTLK